MEEILNETAQTNQEEVTVEKTEIEESSIAVEENAATEPQVNTVEQEVARENVSQKPKQSDEENARFARERREKESQAKIDKAREETRIQTIIDIVGENPYTHEPLKDEFDVKIYEEMKAYEKNGGDPVLDQAKIIKGIVKKSEQLKQETIEKENAKQESDNKAKSDIDDFKAAYPQVDLKSLLLDEKFKDYADGKLGNKPLKDIYSSFIKYNPQVNKEEEKASKEQAKNNASVGSLKGEPSTPTGLLSQNQVSNMSRKQIQDNLDLVMRSMASWK